MPALADDRYTALLDGQLDDVAVQELLAAAGFTDWRAALRWLQQISDQDATRAALAACISHLLAALATAASADTALVSFERFVRATANPHELLAFLHENPRMIEMLVMLFSGSQFLTEILLRNPEYFQRFAERRELAQPKTVTQLYAEAYLAVAPFTELDEQLNALRRFQRWELLRIGASDFFALFDLPTVTSQLSRLADALIQVCLTLAAWRSGLPMSGFAVIALGKLGGGELNYSSDIDLLFLARDDASAYARLGQQLIDSLARMTPQGFLYRVDMRLRPWGGVGALVSSFGGYMAYLQRQARLWEKQALLKARPVAGDEVLGRDFIAAVEPLMFTEAPDIVRANVHRMKQRTESYLQQRGRNWGEVKLGEGSIRDAEFVVQYLQLAHGAQHPHIRGGATLEALSHLLNAGFLSTPDYRVLADGYVFLRAVEHYLQLMHYRQTSTLPKKPAELTHFARRLGFMGADAGAHFLTRYEEQRAALRAVYLRYLGEEPSPPLDVPPLSGESAARLHAHVARMPRSYAATFSEPEIRLHATLADQLDPSSLVQVHTVPLPDGRWRVTIVGYDYFGELSLICGLLSVHGFNIEDGDVFTYEPEPAATSTRRTERPGRGRSPGTPRKIVDVFTVTPVAREVTPEAWSRYAGDLSDLLQLLQRGQQQEVQIRLLKQVAARLRGTTDTKTPLYPIDVEIDNAVSDRYTVLRISSSDTVGFLYEFTHALALHGIYIARVTVDTIGSRVEDTLYVTNQEGHKLTDAARQRELRAATVLVKHFLHLLPRSSDPASALLSFRALLGQLFTRPNWPDDLVSLERPDVLHALAQLLGVSEFLWNDFLRMQYANLFPVVRDVAALADAHDETYLRTELNRQLAASADPRATLNAFKDREMFRIDMRYILGQIAEFSQFAGELSDLADVVVQAAYQLCGSALCAQFGVPRLEDGTAAAMSVCALGKAGGRELGFASDIELMFIYAGSGHTSGPQVITNADFYERLVQEFHRTIQARREGIFEIDLRLRPYGKAGTLAIALHAFTRYFAPGGPAWAYERQSLIRLRPLAGDAALGTQIVALRDAYLFTGEPFDVAAMRAMRERQLRHLVTAGTFNAKFSPGGSVDIEYLVQGLQITYGHADPALRQTNTAAAMSALHAAGIFDDADYTNLVEAHVFIRRLVNALRMVRGNTRDLTVPAAGSEEFVFLARRLGYGTDIGRLQDDLAQHTTFVQQLNQRLLR